MSADVLKVFERHPDLLEICGAPGRAVPQAGLTNQVYRLEAGRGVFFLRLPRPGNAGLVDRQAEAVNLDLAATTGLALPPLFVHPDDGILLTAAVDTLEPAPLDLSARLGDALGRLHGSGAAFAGLLDPDDVYRAQREFLASVGEFQSEIAPLDQAMQDLADLSLNSGTVQPVPVHGDVTPGNCLWTPERLWLIDWEYSAMADPAWDLAYAILEHRFSSAEEEAFLEACKGRHRSSGFPVRERIEAMKVRCDAVSALWALEQVARGRDTETFLPYARGRRDRALSRMRKLV
ncbi:hypothetical protein OA90_24925 [Labrenzia sp. OB1]|nr:hypothetical protein OA90_24925 [Labrenzia sp. OB1]